LARRSAKQFRESPAVRVNLAHQTQCLLAGKRQRLQSYFTHRSYGKQGDA
jgi:hypothetical protein